MCRHLTHNKRSCVWGDVFGNVGVFDGQVGQRLVHILGVVIVLSMMLNWCVRNIIDDNDDDYDDGVEDYDDNGGEFDKAKTF